MLIGFFSFSHHLQILTCKFIDHIVRLLQTNKATTNIFGLHTQPRKTTRYTNILKEKERKKSLLILQFPYMKKCLSYNFHI